MLIILNDQMDIFVDIFTVIISVCALTATLRKKEFGKFYFIPKNASRRDVWIKLTKSDLYDIQFELEPYENMTSRIDVLYPETDKDQVSDFLEETTSKFEFGSLKENTIVKFRNCNASKIQISFRDKYNNLYTQVVTQEKMSRRCHKNFWNLTFVGT